MSSIAQANKIADLENRLTALEAVFLRPQNDASSRSTCESCTCKPDIEKIKNDVQGIKMRMAKKDA